MDKVGKESMTKDSFLKLLMRLLREKDISFSSLSPKVSLELERWGELKGCIAVEKSGRGKHFKVIDESALIWEIEQLSLNMEIQNSSPRVQNLAKNGSTKAGVTKLDYTYCLCKAIGNVVIRQCDKKILVSEITNQLGCFALPVSDSSIGLQTDAELILVENQLLFDDVSWLPSNWNGIVLYYKGNIPTKVLNWLKDCSFSKVTIFPDYDGVGISNYVNLLKFVPSTRWYWIPNWEYCLDKFGSKELWHEDRQHTLFEKIWNSFVGKGFPDSRLERLMNAIRQKGKMLEQEVHFIRNSEIV